MHQRLSGSSGERRRFTPALQSPSSQRATDASQPTRPLGSAIVSGGSEVRGDSEPGPVSFRRMQPPPCWGPETQPPCQPSIPHLQDEPSSRCSWTDPPVYESKLS